MQQAPSIRSKRVRHTASAIGFAIALTALATVVVAHVVPPAKLHPVAAAHRRATFSLNLNPVPWNLVDRDTLALLQELSRVDPPAAQVAAQRLGTLLRDATALGNDGAPLLARADAAKAIFEELTQVVASAVVAHLNQAAASPRERSAALSAVREAQEALRAFEEAMRATDPLGNQRVGQAFLTMTGALGSEGLLGVGANPVDLESFADAVSLVRTYVDDNFARFSAMANRPLAPYPATSATFDPTAPIPVAPPPGHNINKQLPRPRQILNMAARGVDEGDTTLIALGDMAFDSPLILGEPAASLGVSCNTCHNKGTTNPQFFIPGISTKPGNMDVSTSFFSPHANNGHLDALDIPDLRGIRFLAPYGRNGRFDSLREFTRNVIVNEFNGPEPDPITLDALVAYMFEFDFLPNPKINPNGSLTSLASEAARRGEAVFRTPFAQMADMSCASCHVPSSNFVDFKRHDVGSVAGAEPYSRDGALDTPTLLGVKYTAPYFHDGSLPTLRSVNEWFNDRYELGLTERQLADLAAYVETVGEGVDAYEDTVHTLDSEMEEFSFFLSSYEFLAARGKRDIIDTLFGTIALEIRAHRWDLQDWTHMSTLERMAAIMDEAAQANARGEITRTAELVHEYRSLYEEHKEALR